MGAFRYIPPPSGAERLGAPSPSTPARAQERKREPRQRNVEAVLSLGSTRYLRVHNKAYAVAPVSFKLGQRLLEQSINVLKLTKHLSVSGKKEDAEEYYHELSRLAKMMWPHMRPTGRINRMLKRLHLMRNPLLHASEYEIKDVCDFFLQGRMKSSVQQLSMNPALETRTS